MQNTRDGLKSIEVGKRLCFSLEFRLNFHGMNIYILNQYLNLTKIFD
jgi:hypothetical protein